MPFQLINHREDYRTSRRGASYLIEYIIRETKVVNYAYALMARVSFLRGEIRARCGNGKYFLAIGWDMRCLHGEYRLACNRPLKIKMRPR